MNVSCSFRPEHDGTDMSHCRSLARLPETGYTGENRVQAGGSKQERGRACQKDALLSCQPPAEQPYPAVRMAEESAFSPHRSALLMSLFSSTVNCSIMNPLGLSSERYEAALGHVAFTDNQLPGVCPHLVRVGGKVAHHAVHMHHLVDVA